MWMVTGATGNIGGRVLRLLASGDTGTHLIGLVRDGARAQALLPAGVAWRAASYEDRSALTDAFKGVERLLFIASDGSAREILQHHTNVVEAAASAGVNRIGFLSLVDVAPDSPFYMAPVYRDTERRLLESGITWTLLRCGLYADFVFEYWLKRALASGVLELPVLKGRMALVTRENVAAAAAGALASDACSQSTFEITGPQALSGDEIAAQLGHVFDASVTYQPCSPTDYLLHAWATHDDPWPHAFSTMFASIEQGRYARIGSGVRDLTGHEPDSLESFLIATKRLGPWTTSLSGLA